MSSLCSELTKIVENEEYSDEGSKPQTSRERLSQCREIAFSFLKKVQEEVSYICY
jgi:hypothetical protein